MHDHACMVVSQHCNQAIWSSLPLVALLRHAFTLRSGSMLANLIFLRLLQVCPIILLHWNLAHRDLPVAI